LIQRALTLSRKSLLDGRLVDHSESECFAVLDPATSEPLGLVPRTAGAEVGRAVAAASRSQIEWARMRPLDRSELLNRAIDNVERNAEELAQLISLETGRPIWTETVMESKHLSF
jgi:acyl-CoA reductase-like NAD-dependent aldehyde dehydrogenase